MKNRYLILAILLFVLLLIPYFQNIQMNPIISFFFTDKWFLSLYFPIMFASMIEWIFIYKWVEKLLDNLKTKKPNQFDLS